MTIFSRSAHHRPFLSQKALFGRYLIQTRCVCSVLYILHLPRPKCQRYFLLFSKNSQELSSHHIRNFEWRIETEARNFFLDRKYSAFRGRRSGHRALHGDLKETGEQGLEPRLTDPETVVLPLHYSPKRAPTSANRTLHPAAPQCKKIRDHKLSFWRKIDKMRRFAYSVLLIDYLKIHT